MAGTREGGKKAAATNKQKHGDDFYARIGSVGGRNGHTGGFGSDTVGKDGLTGQERAAIAGRKGGQKSKRGPSKHPHITNEEVEKAKAKKERGGWKWLFSGRKDRQ